MEENKFLCPECGTQMYETYERPALNLTCPKCGCKIATTRWEKIDLDSTEYEITLLAEVRPSIDQIKVVSNIISKNFLVSKDVLHKGGVIFKGKAVAIQKYKSILNDNKISYKISPDFPY